MAEYLWRTTPFEPTSRDDLRRVWSALSFPGEFMNEDDGTMAIGGIGGSNPELEYEREADDFDLITLEEVGVEYEQVASPLLALQHFLPDGKGVGVFLVSSDRLRALRGKAYALGGKSEEPILLDLDDIYDQAEAAGITLRRP